MAEMIERFEFAGQKALESEDDRLRAMVPHIQAAIHSLQGGQTLSRDKIVTAVFLMSFLKVFSEVDTPSPRWQRFVRQLMGSRLGQRMIESAGG